MTQRTRRKCGTQKQQYPGLITFGYPPLSTDSHWKMSTEVVPRARDTPSSKHEITRLPVRINLLRHNPAVVLDVDHGKGRPSSVAALVPLRITSDKLLLGELDQLTPGHVPGTLEAPGRAETPAGATVCLSVTNDRQTPRARHHHHHLTEFRLPLSAGAIKGPEGEAHLVFDVRNRAVIPPIEARWQISIHVLRQLWEAIAGLAKACGRKFLERDRLRPRVRLSLVRYLEPPAEQAKLNSKGMCSLLGTPSSAFSP